MKIIGTIWTLIFFALGSYFFRVDGTFYQMAGWFFMLMAGSSSVYMFSGKK